MKVAGIITEYNPFHNGHKHHIEETKRVTGADYVIAVMSGNFVQRGTPALIDKYSRTLMALNNGVDFVLELPVCYATGSAELFALGAVSLLDQLGIVDFLCFGSENGDIELIQKAANFLTNVPKDFDKKLISFLKEGMTYPAARAKAMEHHLDSVDDTEDFTHLSQLLSEPNNILGIEYVKALTKLSSSITPTTIQRQTAHYHDPELTKTGIENAPPNWNLPVAMSANRTIDKNPVISSATAIRRTLLASEKNALLSDVRDSVPADVYNFLSDNYLKTYPISEQDFSSIIKYKLLTENKQSLINYVDLTPDLADRIMNIRDMDMNLLSLLKAVKTKNMTYSRINRAFIHLLLNIKNNSFGDYINGPYTYYARVLGIRREASHLLRKISNNGKLPVITKVTKGQNQLDSIGRQMLSEDITAAHLYNQAVYEKYHTSIINEYKHGICIL